MTKDEVLASAEKLKADIESFAQKQVLGEPIIAENGLHSGLWNVIVQGEAALVGHAHRFIDEALTYVEQLTGKPTDDEVAAGASAPAPAPVEAPAA